MNYILMAVILVPLIWRLFTRYSQGVCWAVFLLTALSAQPVLITGGDLPNFTFQRLILLVLLVATVVKRRSGDTGRPVPLMWALLVYAGVNLLPLVFSIDMLMSVKSYLSFTIEIVLFYIIISKSLQTREQARQVALAGTLALLTVAILAIVERYGGYNPVDALMPAYVRKPQYENDVLSTFPHRILLGTAMAMGWPLALAFAQTGKRFWQAWWPGICVLLLACYLSFSRGPWIAALFGGVVMFLLAGRMVRRQTLVVMLLITVALVARPGVWETISGRAKETADTDSFKGQTYQYRWELWSIAWDKISRSTERALFGFGQGATEYMTFDAVMSYTGETTKLWSWDNHFAATMMETGLVGLASFAGLYSLFLYKIFSLRKSLAKGDEAMHAAIVAAMTAMLFMMSNVAMFAPQLNYLIWSLMAAGLRLGAQEPPEESHDIATA